MEATVDESVEKSVSGAVLEAEKKQNRPGTFVSGDPRGAKRGRPPKLYVQPARDGAPQTLQDMRHVYLNSSRFDETTAHNTMRALFKKDPRGFMSQMNGMEKDHRETMAKERAVKEGVAEDGRKDVGAVKCLEMVERLLEEMQQ